MGYFDDYDSEMGWDYRDESLDDDFSVAMDSDDEEDLGSEFEREILKKEEEEVERKFEFLHGPRRVIERSTFDDEEDQEEEGEEVESSIAEVESSVAEDELIHRLSFDPFMGNRGTGSAVWPSHPSPLMSVPAMSNRATMSASPPPPITPPSSPLPSSWSFQENQYDGVSGIIQRFQYLETQNNGFTQGGGSTGTAGNGRTSSVMTIISPPASPPPFPYYPPRRSSLTDQSISKNVQSLSSSPTPLVYLPSPSISPPPSRLSGRPLPTDPVELNLKGKLGGGTPRLDRAQALGEGVERKRNSVGAFDAGAGTGAGAFSSTSDSSASRNSDGRVVDHHQQQQHHRLLRRPSSMVASASNLLRCSRALASH